MSKKGTANMWPRLPFFYYWLLTTSSPLRCPGKRGEVAIRAACIPGEVVIAVAVRFRSSEG